MISNSTKVLVTMMTESQTRSVSVSVTNSDYYNISLTGNSVCSGNLTTSVTTDSELYSMCTLIIIILLIFLVASTACVDSITGECYCVK